MLFVFEKSVLEEQHLDNYIYIRTLETSTDNIVRVRIDTSRKAMESEAMSRDAIQFNEAMRCDAMLIQSCPGQSSGSITCRAMPKQAML